MGGRYTTKTNKSYDTPSSTNTKFLGTDKLPLQFIKYNANIKGTMSNITLTHTYVNNDTTDTEVSFFMPVDPSIVVHGLTIKTKDKTIIGKIMPKQKAEEKYEQSKVSGNQGYLAKESDEKPDTIVINIGKLVKDEKVDVELSFSMLTMIEDESWALHLPLKLERAFNERSAENDIYSSSIKFAIDVNIESLTPITRLTSTRHKPTITFSNKENTKANIVLQQDSNLLGDFTLLYRYADMKSPSIIYEGEVAKGEQAYGICFTPSYCEEITKLGEVDMSTEKTYEDATLQGTGEFIFLLDTSGSMSGSKITMAVDSLVYFMKSLPQNSKFNIVLFDSTYNSYYKESVKYSEESVTETLNRIKNEKFRFGGTEIYNPLKSVFSKKPDPDYPRVLFLLTDGEVSDKNRVISLIQENSKLNIVNALGIGNDVDRELISKSAKAGRGYYKIVSNADMISSSVIDMLSHSVKPAYVNMSIEWPSKPLLAWPKLDSVPYAYQGDQIYLCGIFSHTLKGNAKISFVDTNTLEKKCLTVSLDGVYMNATNLGKVVAHNCIKNGGNEKEIGIKYGILCKETAIYAEIKSNTPGSTEIKHCQIELQKELAIEHNEKEYSKQSYGGNMMKCKRSMAPPNICAMPMAPSLPHEQCLAMPMEDEVEYKCMKATTKCDKEMKKNSNNNLLEAEESMPGAPQIQRIEPEEEKAPTIQAISKVGLSSIIESQKISGLWEVASVVIQLQKSEDVIKNSIPENIKGTAGDQALSAWATIIMLVILYKKYSADQSKWKLIANKAIGKLKSLKIVYANYQADAEKLI